MIPLIAIPRGLVYLIVALYWLAVIGLTRRAFILNKRNMINRKQLISSILFIWLLPIVGPFGIYLFLKKAKG